MSDTPIAIGIDVGGTSVKTGVVYRSNIIGYAPQLITADFDGPEALIARLSQEILAMRERHPSIRAVGIGVPGLVNFEKGIVSNLTNVAGWTNIPLGRLLSETVDLPVIVENDANCMAFAEWKRGAGRGLRHIVCITLGTGVGGAIIANGQLIRGSRFGAGEIGQTSIDFRGRRGHYGNLGSLEDYIGIVEITQAAEQRYAAAGIEKNGEDCLPSALASAAHRGDKIALEIWEEVGEKLATAVMNACWLLNPEAVIIGGGVARAGELIFQPLTACLYPQLSPTFRDHLMVIPARFGNEAGMIGAAALALESAGYVIEP